MKRQEFVELLAEEGFGEIVTVEREANGSLDVHTHPFEAKALILEGDICIRSEGSEHRFLAGEIFHLAPNTPHSETYGPQGVIYLVGRK